MEFFRLTCIGLVLGITTVLPGLSAGTMAITFNVYERLIAVITPNIKKVFTAWKFWLPLATGGIVGILLFSKTISFLYENYPFPAIWFFIGVIAGSIPMVYKKTCKVSSSNSNALLPSTSSIICAILALTAMILTAMIRPNEGLAVYTEPSMRLFGIMALAGGLAAMALIIPGISGAFMLLVIGLYRTVLKAVSDMNIPLLMPFALGAAAGLLFGAALIRFLLLKAPGETYGAVLGLVAGSVIILFPGGFGYGVMIIFSALSFLTGAVISFFSGGRKE